jgi:hypothetical protein
MRTTLRACIVMVFLLAASRVACAQPGVASATLTGQVSGAVVVSASEARTLSDGAQVSTANIDATTVAVSITSSGGNEARINLPLRLRSNVGYRLRASFLSRSELAVRLSVADFRATGKFVHANALAGIRLGEALTAPRGGHAPFLTLQNPSSQLALLGGPPVSKAGTFDSPDNAIEIVLSVEVRPQAAGEPWSTQLTISAAPNPRAGR